MPSTLDAVAVVGIALLPGGLYLWAFERVVGRWGVGFADRLLRFVGVSAAFQAVVAPVTYNVWLDYLRPDAMPGTNELPLWRWLVALAYFAAPTALGYFTGWRYRIGGEYAAGSFAVGHPEPSDLFLSVEALVDQAEGEFVVDDAGKPVPTGYGVLVKWPDVDYLELAEAEIPND